MSGAISGKIVLSPPQVLVLGFLSIILAGAILLTLPGFTTPGRQTDFLTALFTSTSAVCVTGLVVVDTGTHWTLPGQILILMLIQVGGLGFMTMAMIFFISMGKKIGLKKRMIIKESLNKLNIEGVVRLVKIILIFTLVVEMLAASVLGIWWAREMGPVRGMWYGLFHSVSAFNNAGFDLNGGFRSLTRYAQDPVVNVVMATLIILGGLGFSVIYDLLDKIWNKKGLSLHSQLVVTATAALLLLGAAVITGLEWNSSLKEMPLKGKLLGAFFQSVTPRTAGFNTIDLSALRPATVFFVMMLMFIGASPGSTGGGIKTTTFGLLLLAVKSTSKGREDVEIYNKRIPFQQVYKALAIFILSVSWVVLATMVLTATEKTDFLKLLFEAVSAFGTVGLSLGITPHLTDIGRVIIILTMFLGRLGPLTIAFALALKTTGSKIRYPEEKIIVG